MISYAFRFGKSLHFAKFKFYCNEKYQRNSFIILHTFCAWRGINVNSCALPISLSCQNGYKQRFKKSYLNRFSTVLNPVFWFVCNFHFNFLLMFVSNFCLQSKIQNNLSTFHMYTSKYHEPNLIPPIYLRLYNML
jgi:hypothetical protein